MENIYLPKEVKIGDIKELTEKVKQFRIEDIEGKTKKNDDGIFEPGQFFLLGKWGYGESPFDPVSSPFDTEHLDFVIEKMGNVTGALHASKKEEKITLRGPYGNGFPIDKFKGNNIIMIMEKFLIPPVIALAKYTMARRNQFGQIWLIYWGKTPKKTLLTSEIDGWRGPLNIIMTVDEPDNSWTWRKGGIIEALENIEINPKKTFVAMSGFKQTADKIFKALNPKGLVEENIYLANFRKMYCGIGKCQHCTTGKDYVCTNGPILNYKNIKNNTD